MQISGSNRQQPRVYFAFWADQVKIGISNNPRRRVRAIHPKIKLLADIPGDQKTEAQLHKRFQEFRIAGEWFHFTKEIDDFVKEQLNAQHAEWFRFTKELADFVKTECSVVKYAPFIIIYEPSEALPETSLKHELPYPVWLTLTQAETYSSLPASVLQRLIADRRLRTRTGPKGKLIARASIDRLMQ
jgi:hypothetical protein